MSTRAMTRSSTWSGSTSTRKDVACISVSVGGVQGQLIRRDLTRFSLMRHVLPGGAGLCLMCRYLLGKPLVETERPAGELRGIRQLRADAPESRLPFLTNRHFYRRVVLLPDLGEP